MKTTLKKIGAFVTLILIIFLFRSFLFSFWEIPHNITTYGNYFTSNKGNTWHMIMWTSKDHNSFLVQPVDTHMIYDYLGRIYVQPFFTMRSSLYERWVTSDEKHNFTRLHRGDFILATKDSIQLVDHFEFQYRQKE